MIFYDFEVFKDDWLCVVLDFYNQEETLVINDPGLLEVIYRQHKDDIWVGYNNRHYDLWIKRAILGGYNPKAMNDWIIKEHNNPYDFDSEINKFESIEYDVIGTNDGGLKSLEGYMGHNIKESSIPFDIDRKLTEDELLETIEYCRHDVEETVEVFFSRIDDFNSQLFLLKKYELPLGFMSRTKSQLSAQILGAEKISMDDDFNTSIPETAIVKKYTQVVDFYKNYSSYDDSLPPQQIAGMDVQFGIGGGHGALKNYHSKGYFLNVDVGSLYPSLMRRYPDQCFSRAVNEDGIKRFVEILTYRFKLKKEGKKKEQAPFKLILNSTYGCFKDRYNAMFDPRAANNVCIYGQILVCVDLVERLEDLCQIMQINTDGLLLKLKYESDFYKVDDICYEWEQRTGLSLDFDDYGYGELWQKDVNNYLIKSQDGIYKCKGSWLKEQNDLDYQQPILNDALREYMVNNTPIEETINNCTDLRKFQTIIKASTKFDGLLYGGTRIKNKGSFIHTGGQKLNERCVRGFATTDQSKGSVWLLDGGKAVKPKGITVPDHIEIINENILDLEIPAWLDKKWYINLAKARLEKFGV